MLFAIFVFNFYMLKVFVQGLENGLNFAQRPQGAKRSSRLERQEILA